MRTTLRIMPHISLHRDTTKPPEKGVKYVCCGGCRQWLMAPRDAVYVVCSTCEAINNCNLVPKVQIKYPIICIIMSPGCTLETLCMDTCMYGYCRQ